MQPPAKRLSGCTRLAKRVAGSGLGRQCGKDAAGGEDAGAEVLGQEMTGMGWCWVKTEGCEMFRARLGGEAGGERVGLE